MRINVKKIHTFTGHRDCIYALCGSSDGKIFYSSGGDGYVVKWDLEEKEDGQLLAKIDSSVYALHYAQHKDTLIIGQNNDGIHLIDSDSKKIEGSLKLTSSTIFDITSFEKHAFIGAGDGFLFVVDLDELKVVDKIKLSEKSLRTLSLNNTSTELAVGASDNSIYIFDLRKQGLIKKIAGHKNSVFGVNYSGADDHLVSVSRDAHINFWNAAEDYSLDDSIPAHMYAINNIDFRADKVLFATGSMDKTIKIWDYGNRKLLKVIDRSRYDGHLSSVNKLYWSNYKNYLVSASDDRTISVWDLQLIY